MHEHSCRVRIDIWLIYTTSSSVAFCVFFDVGLVLLVDVFVVCVIASDDYSKQFSAVVALFKVEHSVVTALKI